MPSETMPIEFLDDEDWLRANLDEGQNVLPESDGVRPVVTVRNGRAVDIRATEDNEPYWYIQRVSTAAAADGGAANECYFCVRKQNPIRLVCKKVTCIMPVFPE